MEKRSTLYRAISLETKKWIYANIMNGFNGFYIDEETIGQYTGLTDSVGNDIFEGDIVSKNIAGQEKKYEVVFYVDGFCLQRLNKESYHQKSIRTPKRINYKDWGFVKVIGNIHE